MTLEKRTHIANKTIQICGSKSISNRLLILNALFQNVKINNLSDSQDTRLLQEALASDSEIIDINHAGTAMRFLTSYFAIQPGKEVVLTGSERMKQRPIGFLVDALRDLGAEIEYLENKGFPPLKITGKNIVKSNVKIPADVSSQFITSLILIGAKLQNGLNIELSGKITSRPYIEMTLQILKIIGIETEFSGNKISIKNHKFDDKKSNIFHYVVESDWSSASYFYSLSAISRKNISLKSFNNHSYQGDSALKEIYWECFGVNTVTDIQEHTISLFPETFIYPDSIRLNMNDCPDIAQTVCVTATALKVPFELTGLATLKVKETDRLLALQNELKKIGCETEISDDAIKSVNFAVPDENIVIKTYHDHRMAMSFAPFSLIQNLEIEDETVVEKSYPKFWEDFNEVTEPIN